MNWTTENTLVALGYVAIIIGALFALVLYLALMLYVERRTQLLQQVDEVKARLVRSTSSAIYRTSVQMATDGSLVQFDCRIPLARGMMVTLDIRGQLAPIGINNTVLGTVVTQELKRRS